MSRRPWVATLLLVIAAALLGLGLFFAGAAWRARVTSPTLNRGEISRDAAKLAKINHRTFRPP